MPLDPQKLRKIIGTRSVSEVARAAEMQIPDLFRILAGKNSNPKLATLEGLAKALGCKIGDFVG